MPLATSQRRYLRKILRFGRWEGTQAPEGRDAVAGASPAIRQRELGFRLRKLRTDRGLTVEEVGSKLLCSATKISRAETGARRASLRDVRDLCLLYGVDAATTDELMNLAREARQAGWWTQYDDLKDCFPFIGMEQDATSITCFGMYFVPALLQTADYARAIIRGIVPAIGDDVLERRVEVRLRRQELLRRPKPLRYRALIDEAVLHRAVGGPAVMRAQLEKLLRLPGEHGEHGEHGEEGEGRVTVQVIPFEAGAYAAADSNFDYLEFDVPGLPDLVYIEGLARGTYLDRPADLERYREALGYLRGTALSPRESRRKIEETGVR
jgi:transcriptional regulator with XRE-family HTH domain